MCCFISKQSDNKGIEELCLLAKHLQGYNTIPGSFTYYFETYKQKRHTTPNTPRCSAGLRSDECDIII